MRIRALANGNVIEADDEAAKILIENKIYEAAPDEPVTASLTPPVVPPTVAAKPTKKRNAR